MIQVTAFFSLLTFSQGLASDGVAFFESKVRPILEENCLKCHSEAKKVKGGLLLDRKAGWIEGGDSGAVIVPGKPAESLLIRMIRHEADVEAMPPKSKLSNEDVSSLVEWVAMGAPDPRNEAIGTELKKSGFDLEERKKWWSLQAVKKVNVPAVTNKSWAREDLDRFILAELEKKDWEPAEEADRVTLFRRVSVVLTGLAPAPGELAIFLADQEDGAYERAVDRLLASPHFGEQWARHWMDVVRYGESKAFENDYWMPYTWRYRDYLIRAFNADVPFDQFVREALAGDLLEKPRLNPKNGHNESVMGPGFLHLVDGHHGVTDLHEDEARVIDSMINVVGTAFHGLTISCARCHDHKFDAITDEDYYSMYGMFRSSRLHYANVAGQGRTAEDENKLRSSHQEVVGETLKNARQADLSKILTEVRNLSEDHGMVKAWREMKAKDEKGLEKLRRELNDLASPEAARWFEAIYASDRQLELAGMRHLFDPSLPAPKKREVTPAHDWQKHGVAFEEAGRGKFLLSPADPKVIQAAAGSGMVAGHLSSRLDGTLRTADFVLDGNPVRLWVKGKHATVSLVVRNHELVGHGPTTRPLKQEVNKSEWRLIQFPTILWKGELAFLQVQHQGAAKRVLGAGAGGVQSGDDAWVAVTNEIPDWSEVWKRGASVEEVVTSLLTDSIDGTGAEVLASLFEAGLIQPNRDEEILKSKLNQLTELRMAVDSPVYVRSLVEGTSKEEPVYIRGNHKRPSEEKNPRHFLDGLGGEGIEGNGSGRLRWAGHLLDPENPLTARVRINRIWSRIFGRGLVASVDDFGKMGEAPSHPELLDFLASDFVREDWSTKAMVRKMVLSSAFRMSSVPSCQAAELDPANVFLQRMSIRRMSAESIRDHIIAASGELNSDLLGPSILAFIDDQPASRAKPRGGPLGGEGRRSIYLASRRNYLPSFLRAFDSPNASEPIGKRNVTTVPAQSLALLNHPLVHRQARIWGSHIAKSEGSDEEKLKTIHRVAFSREATSEEIVWGISALKTLSQDAEKAEAWAALCHIIMNRKEFIYVL